MYNPFRNIPLHIGTSTDEIILNLKELQSIQYIRWHVNNIEEHCTTKNSEDLHLQDIPQFTDQDLYEWEFLSQMGASNNFDVFNLQILGKHEFDLHFNWSDSIPNEMLHRIASQFISMEKSQSTHTLGNIHSNAPNTFEFAANQKSALDIVTSHTA